MEGRSVDPVERWFKELTDRRRRRGGVANRIVAGETLVEGPE
jgi:hypothetical protein